METWNQKWKNARKERSYHGTPARILNPPITTTNQETRAATTRLITGHGFTRSYLHRIPTTKITSLKCQCGNGMSDQIREHLVRYWQNDNLPAMRGRLQ